MRLGHDVLTAQADGGRELPDDQLLDRATALGRVVFTQDEDFLAEATARQRGGRHFGGVIFSAQRALSYRSLIDHLHTLAAAGVNADFEDRLMYVP